MSWFFRGRSVRGSDEWAWVRLQPKHLDDIYRVDEKSNYLHFGCEVKRIYPEFAVDFPTEFRRETSVRRSVKIRAAQYLIDASERKIAVLPVRISVGESEEPRGTINIMSKKDRDGIEVWCYVEIGIPCIRDQISLFVAALGACVPPSGSQYMRPKKFLAFSCKATIDKNETSSTDDNLPLRIGGTIRDMEFSVEVDEEYDWGQNAFIARNDYGLIEHASWLNSAIRNYPWG